MTHRFKTKKQKTFENQKLTILSSMLIFASSFFIGIHKLQEYYPSEMSPSNSTSPSQMPIRQLQSIIECIDKSIWAPASVRNTMYRSKDFDNMNFQLIVFGQLAAIIYIFNGLAILARKYQNDSIQELADEFSLDKDLASSTLLSFGGSTPELAISFQAMFIDSNLAFGTIFGSSLFNTLLLGATACFSSRSTDMVNWFPVTRDILFSFIAIGLSVMVLRLNFQQCKLPDPQDSGASEIVFMESQVGWWSLLLICVQIIQIIFMKFSVKIEKQIKSMFKMNIADIQSTRSNQENANSKELIQQVGQMILQEGKMQDLPSLKKIFQDFLKARQQRKDSLTAQGSSGYTEIQTGGNKEHSPLAYLFSTFVKAYKVYQECSRYQNRSGYKNYFKNMEEKNDLQQRQSEEKSLDADDAELNNPFIVPAGFLPMLKWLLDLPINILQFQTIPNLHDDSNRQVLSFIMCLVYILLYSVLEMLLALEVSRMLQIDPILIGIALLSLGSGIPDLLEVLDEVEGGESQNAVLQSTGSNIFVQSLALPLPILLQRLVSNEGLNKVFQQSDQLQVSQAVVAGAFLLQLIVFWAFSWKMRWWLGLLLTVLYLASIIGLVWINFNGIRILTHP